MTHHPETERDPAADLAVCAAATPGPATIEHDSSDVSASDWWNIATDKESIGRAWGKEDAVFWAMARTALPHYIRESLSWRERAERAEGEREEMREARRLAVLAQYKERDRAEKAEAALTAARSEAARLRGVVEAARARAAAIERWSGLACEADEVAAAEAALSAAVRALGEGAKD